MNSRVEPDVYSALRQQMVNSQLRDRGIRDGRVLAAMARVPRHEFTVGPFREQAYEDHPLPIGEEQTISQPYIVALMLQALRISPSDKVLEIGTGSGYVTALLSELTKQVYSIERHASLAQQARDILRNLGYTEARIVIGDGSRGLSEAAPYDVIIVSAAAPALPQELLAQLADGGRMIIPVGTDDAQQLQSIERYGSEVLISPREMCRFVPLVSGPVF
jgi:protein-L-isoaspartate(D-aspartate) O-methyltransferase